MPWLAALLAVSPVIVIFVLIAFLKKAADTAGVIGWFFTLAVAIIFFKTSPGVCLKASAAGVVASLPISLMVAASLFQMGVMLECGAVARLVATLKGVAREDRVAQILIINVGFGTLLTALGATFEGIHRKHMLVRDGENRDSAWYSVTNDDWPGVRAHLEARLAAP